MSDLQLEMPALVPVRQFADERGVFVAEKLTPNLVQINISMSDQNVLRGMHFQIGDFAQSKKIRVLRGKVIDVIVDIRRETNNPNFGKAQYFILEGIQKSQNEHSFLYVPKGFAHGFLALEDNTIFEYLVDNPYHPQSDRSINWQSFPIWKEILDKYSIDQQDLKLSDKDANAPMLEDWLKLNENFIL
jgi:dTDP-4-dehydrorhamnose 3,5-epimerase